MKIKRDTDIVAFLKAVERSTGNVEFVTEEGDQLNLKSTLSQYVFAVIGAKPELWQHGKILCDDESLLPYLEQE